MDNNFIIDSLKSGAFLASGNNVMVIGWGGIGYIWGKQVFYAPVRYSRHTKNFIDENKTFALSFPKVGTMKEEIKLCGTKSGKNVDKKSLLNTSVAPKSNSFFVDGCIEFMECKVLATIPITPNLMENMPQDFYKNEDYHVMYIAEIL